MMKHTVDLDDFVGRDQEIKKFTKFLNLKTNSRIINISGERGVGKTELLKYFLVMANNQACTWPGLVTYETLAKELALKNVSGINTIAPELIIPAILGCIRKQLDQHKDLPVDVSGAFQDLDKNYRLYRKSFEDLLEESEADTKTEIIRFVAKFSTKTLMSIAAGTPWGTLLSNLIESDEVAKQAEEWVASQYNNLKNEDERLPLDHPVDRLTSLFLDGLRVISEHHTVVLFFDDHDHNQIALEFDHWLQELLAGDYGVIPDNLLFVIAGKVELDYWSEWDILPMPLSFLEESEVDQYLHSKGVDNQETQEEIKRLSHGLPCLIKPLVNLALKGEPLRKPEKQIVRDILKEAKVELSKEDFVLNGATPRHFNRDVLEKIANSEEKKTLKNLFNWLIDLSFVDFKNSHWEYNDIARYFMSQFNRDKSERDWRNLHENLASFYDELKQKWESKLGKVEAKLEIYWQQYDLEYFYHHLCQFTKPFDQGEFKKAIQRFLYALWRQFQLYRSSAYDWAEAINQAGEDADNDELKCLGERLLKSLRAYNHKKFQESLELFTVLLEEGGFESKTQAQVYQQRSIVFQHLKDYSKALDDLEQARSLDQQNTNIIATQGIVYSQMDLLPDAQKYFNQAIAIDSKSGIAFAGRAVTYQLMGDMENALKDFNQAIKLLPNQTDLLITRGILNSQLNHNQEALSDLSIALELDPGNLVALKNRSEVLRSIERFDEANEDIRRFLKFSPKVDVRDQLISSNKLNASEALLTETSKTINRSRIASLITDSGSSIAADATKEVFTNFAQDAHIEHNIGHNKARISREMEIMLRYVTYAACVGDASIFDDRYLQSLCANYQALGVPGASVAAGVQKMKEATNAIFSDPKNRISSDNDLTSGFSNYFDYLSNSII